MSLVHWKPASAEGYKTIPMKPVEIDGWECIAHWFGEDSYDPFLMGRKKVYWLQLYDTPGADPAIRDYNRDTGRLATLRGFSGPTLLEITDELIEDACGFMGWHYWRVNRLPDGRSVELREEPLREQGVDIFQN